MIARKSARSYSLTLAGVGLGCLLSGAFVGRTAFAQHHEHEHDHYDHNPRVHEALDALHAAQAELDGAHDDYHGHKQEAQAAVQHAIDELDRIKDW